MTLLLNLLSSGISKYLRHSESTSAKHYDFSHVEQSARNRVNVLDLIGGKYLFTQFAVS